METGRGVKTVEGDPVTAGDVPRDARVVERVVLKGRFDGSVPAEEKRYREDEYHEQRHADRISHGRFPREVHRGQRDASVRSPLLATTLIQLASGRKQRMRDGAPAAITPA